MIESITYAIGMGLFIIGLFFAITGVIGVLRMPNVFARLHPAGVVDTASMIFISLGLILTEGFGFLSLKIIIICLFALITSATACNILAKIALEERRQD